MQGKYLEGGVGVEVTYFFCKYIKKTSNKICEDKIQGV
jgi:hypothetical protein